MAHTKNNCLFCLKQDIKMWGRIRGRIRNSLVRLGYLVCWRR